MMKVQVQTFPIPRWVIPAMILIALALIPFALLLGLALTAVAVGLSALRIFLPSPSQSFAHHSPAVNSRLKVPRQDSPVIDADYEIKGENGEK